jgi:hypothetical protein
MGEPGESAGLLQFNERKALTPLRDKAFKTTRQFIVERPN